MMTTLSTDTERRIGHLIEEVHEATGDPVGCVAFIESAVRDRLDAVAAEPSKIAGVVDVAIISRALEALRLVEARMATCDPG